MLREIENLTPALGVKMADLASALRGKVKVSPHEGIFPAQRMVRDLWGSEDAQNPEFHKIVNMSKTVRRRDIIIKSKKLYLAILLFSGNQEPF